MRNRNQETATVLTTSRESILRNDYRLAQKNRKKLLSRMAGLPEIRNAKERRVTRCEVDGDRRAILRTLSTIEGQMKKLGFRPGKK